MCEILVNDMFDELREENNRLNSDLCYERQVNKILENIKNYSIILKNNCICGQNIDIFKKLNDLEIEYKLLKTIRNVNKTDVKQTLNYKSVENNNPLNQLIKSDVNQSNSDIQMTSPSIITRSVNKSTENLSKTKEISVEPETTPNCNECKQIFDTELDLVLHVNRYHKNVESFICHECNQVFDSRDVFSIHLRQHQTNEDKSQTNSKPKFKTITDYLRSYRKPSTTSALIGVNLTENEPKFDFMSDLLKPGTSSDGSDNSYVISLEKIKVEPNYDSLQEFRCHSCLKGFECDDDLGVHVRESHPNLVCRQCNEWFYSKDDIFTHVSNFHKTPNQVFGCDSCNFSTTSKSSLNEHTHKNHCTENLLKCEDCGNVFKTKSAIISHKKYCRKNLDKNKTQVLVKPINDIFCCDFCDYKTEKAYNLQKHKKRQHFTAPLVCNINSCGQTFNRIDGLKSHQNRVHRNVFNANQLNPIVFEKTTENNAMEGIGQHLNYEQTSEEHINSSFGEEVKLEFISDSDNESNIKVTEVENYSFDFSKRLKSVFNNKKIGNEKQNKGFKCDFPNCAKICSRQDLVNRHKREVHKQYSQRKIQKRVKTKSSAIKNKKIISNSNHLKTSFEGVSNDSNKPFACNIEGCRYSANKKKYLSDHLRRIHNNGPKFVCNYPNCKRRFDSQLILEQHMKCHKNRFVCRWSGCQFRTHTFAKLNEHKRSDKHLKTESESID